MFRPSCFRLCFRSSDHMCYGNSRICTHGILMIIQVWFKRNISYKYESPSTLYMVLILSKVFQILSQNVSFVVNIKCQLTCLFHNTYTIISVCVNVPVKMNNLNQIRTPDAQWTLHAPLFVTLWDYILKWAIKNEGHHLFLFIWIIGFLSKWSLGGCKNTFPHCHL